LKPIEKKLGPFEKQFWDCLKTLLEPFRNTRKTTISVSIGNYESTSTALPTFLTLKNTPAQKIVISISKKLHFTECICTAFCSMTASKLPT
jgi:hypothetical protein